MKKVLLCALALLVAAVPAFASIQSRALVGSRNVTLELTNDSSEEIRHVYVELYNSWRKESMDTNEQTLNGPLKPGQKLTFSFSLDDIDSKSGMFHVFTWTWDDKGNCKGGSRFPDTGTQFTLSAGTAKCDSGKTTREQMRADQLDEILTIGEAAYSEKRWADAIDAYTKVLALDSSNFDAWHRRGHAYQMLKEPDKAIADFTRAMSLTTDKADLYNDRALTYAMKKDWASSLADYNWLLGQKAADDDSRFRRSIVYCLQGKRDLAEADEKVLLDKGLELPSTCKTRPVNK